MNGRGLIAQPRKSDGPRHYDDGVLATLRYAKLAQQLGFSLKEIRALQAKLTEGETFCASLRAMVEANSTPSPARRRRSAACARS